MEVNITYMVEFLVCEQNLGCSLLMYPIISLVSDNAMDTPRAFCLFFQHSEFIDCLEFCQLLQFDVTDRLLCGHDTILFFDSVQFLNFLALINNNQHVTWAFL